VHTANSAASLTLPNSHFDAVRVGLSLYGIYPSPHIAEQQVVSLRPALSWKARITCLREAAPGEGVSYGRIYRTDQPTWLATLPIGYADGYPRTLSNVGDALIGGLRRQLVGRVCMDGTVFRVDPPVNVAIGDEAVLIGTQGGQKITVDQVAAKVATISYEILTGIGKRVPRVYVNPTGTGTGI
jgi:alanine racemase